jgi:hypothetical protein
VVALILVAAALVAVFSSVTSKSRVRAAGHRSQSQRTPALPKKKRSGYFRQFGKSRNLVTCCFGMLIYKLLCMFSFGHYCLIASFCALN